MKPYEIIQALEADNSRLAKEAIIATEATNPDFWNIGFFKGCQLALDSLVTFGVKNVPVTKTDGPGLSESDFFSLAESLQARNLTGHAARDAVQECADKATMKEWNDWYRRILIKDLRCGTSEKTINNVVKKINKDFMVPVFGCMLAHDGAKHEKKIKGDCLVEYKYDGVRVIAIVQNGSATLYSRNGKILTNFPHIEEALSKPYFNDYVFDGEVMSEDFQALMKQVHRKSGAKTDDAYLALFDVLSIKEFNKGKSICNTIERKQMLKDMSFEAPIRVVDYHEIDFDTDEGQAQFQELNKTALEKGYEGLMIKPVNALYECKRSHAWLKIKPFIEVSLEIVDTEEGTGKNVGKLGALICEGTDDGVFIQVNVGSGLTDDQRETFWAVKDALIGELAEVRADAITQNQDGTYSLRFPRFKTFRGFEVGEKI
jgi:DNA ligase-1